MAGLGPAIRPEVAPQLFRRKTTARRDAAEWRAGHAFAAHSRPQKCEPNPTTDDLFRAFDRAMAACPILWITP